jgi:thiamine-phosphate pyrophosphorylase
MKAPVPRVHAVTDDGVASQPDLARIAGALAVSADIALHARAPGWEARRLIALTRTLSEAAAPRGARVLVNDRVDVARLCPVDGVHLPEEGLPIPIARDLLGPEALIGQSVHSRAAARAAADRGADYVILGPIWETTSHPGRAPLGPAAVDATLPIPVIAIGGITPERARICREAGAWGVAAISALWRASDPGSAVCAMLLSFGREPDSRHGERPDATTGR